MSSSYILGIDLGTTTVKACLLLKETGSVAHTSSQETKASIPSDLGSVGNEQDVHRICTAVQFCVSRLPRELMSRIVDIAVSGQMHGCMLWRSGHSWKQNQHGRFEVDNVSCLYTWQDRRCDSSFLDSLPKPMSHLRLSTGHGCATLLWLVANRSDMTERYDRAGTVQDLVVAMLCELDRACMSTQTAASWGYFNTVQSTWNTELLEEASLPLIWLPDIVSPGSVAGHTSTPWYGIPIGTPVYSALGDMQCSVYSSLIQENDAVVNISTSAQISFIMPEDFEPPETQPETPIEYFPYFKGRYLAVAASLNGGNVLAAFVKMLQQWTHELGLGVPESKIWERILCLSADDSSLVNLMEVVPMLYGERHLPDQRASVQHIEPSSLALGKVFRSLCKGLIHNLYSMMSKEDLDKAGVCRMVGSGTALIKNKILQNELEKLYDLPVNYGDGSDAAVGAASAILSFLN